MCNAMVSTCFNFKNAYYLLYPKQSFVLIGKKKELIHVVNTVIRMLVFGGVLEFTALEISQSEKSMLNLNKSLKKLHCYWTDL